MVWTLVFLNDVVFVTKNVYTTVFIYLYYYVMEYFRQPTISRLITDTKQPGASDTFPVEKASGLYNIICQTILLSIPVNQKLYERYMVYISETIKKTRTKH